MWRERRRVQQLQHHRVRLPTGQCHESTARTGLCGTQRTAKRWLPQHQCYSYIGSSGGYSYNYADTAFDQDTDSVYSIPNRLSGFLRQFLASRLSVVGEDSGDACEVTSDCCPCPDDDDCEVRQRQGVCSAAQLRLECIEGRCNGRGRED